MGAIKNAFKAIGKGIEKAVEGAAQVAKGICTLDLKAASQGLKQIAHAGADIARGAINLTPAALAANTLLDGALDKMLKKAQTVVEKVADTLVDNVEGGLSNIKKGVENTVKGIATGDLGRIASGMKDLALGAVETASNFGPGGIAKNVARMAVDAAIDVAAQETTKAACKVLDPNGESKLGGMAADLVGAGVSGGLGASRAGRFASGDVDSLRRKPGMDDGPGSCGPTGFRQGARNGAENAALDMAETAISQAINEVMAKLQTVLNPNGDSAAADAGVNALTGLAEDSAASAIDRRRQRLNDGPQHQQPNPQPNTQPNHAAPVQQNQGPDATGRAGLRNDMRDAVHGAMLQALDMAIQVAVQAAVEQAVRALPQNEQGAFAALALHAAEGAVLDASQRATSGRSANTGGANGAGGAGGAAGAQRSLKESAQDIKQGLRDAIETAVRAAIEQAIAGAVDQVLQQALQGANPSGGAQGTQPMDFDTVLRQGLQHALKDAATKVIGATVEAIGQAAAKALAQGLGEAAAGRLPAEAGQSLGRVGQVGQVGQGRASDVNLHIHIRA